MREREREGEGQLANTLESNDMLLHFGTIAGSVTSKISRHVASSPETEERMGRADLRSVAPIPRSDASRLLRYIYISLGHVSVADRRVRNEFITLAARARVLIRRNEHSRRTRNVF